MIYITGDTHGDFRNVARFCEKMQTNKDDVLIILGDAGINYYGGEQDTEKKEYLETLPITIFAIHGNHEMRPQTIPTYHEAEWNGGTVYMEDEYPHILFAKDGELYDIGGQRTFVIGGAYSVDKAFRLLHGLGWWPDEQPSEEIKRRIEENLDEIDWSVDVVLTHTAPLKYEPREVFLPGINQSMVDKSTEQWLDTIEERLDYKNGTAGIIIPLRRSKESNSCSITLMNFHKRMTRTTTGMSLTSVPDASKKGMIIIQMKTANKYVDAWNVRLIR